MRFAWRGSIAKQALGEKTAPFAFLTPPRWQHGTRAGPVYLAG